MLPEKLKTQTLLYLGHLLFEKAASVLNIKLNISTNPPIIIIIIMINIVQCWKCSLLFLTFLISLCFSKVHIENVKLNLLEKMLDKKSVENLVCRIVCKSIKVTDSECLLFVIQCILKIKLDK